MRRVAIIVTLIIASTSCEQTTPVAPTPRPEVDPAYAIYSLVLDSLFLGTVQANRSPPQFIIIQSTDSTGEGQYELEGEWFEKEFASHKNGFDIAAAAFRTTRTTRTMLDPTQFRAHAPIQLVSPYAVSHEGLGKPSDYWAAFYDRYPGARGIIQFKKLVIDPSGKFALLHYRHGCGYLCADYGFILLEKQDSRWVILKRVIYMFS